MLNYSKKKHGEKTITSSRSADYSTYDFYSTMNRFPIEIRILVFESHEFINRFIE